jgi:hypothetical protein
VVDGPRASRYDPENNRQLYKQNFESVNPNKYHDQYSPLKKQSNNKSDNNFTNHYYDHSVENRKEGKAKMVKTNTDVSSHDFTKGPFDIASANNTSNNDVPFIVDNLSNLVKTKK